MKEYIGSDEHFIDSVNARHEQKEQDDKKMKEEIDKQVNQQEWKPFEWTAMQIAVYAINCQSLDRYVDEVTSMIERYADTKVYNELEKPAEDFNNEVLSILKSMTLSMAAHHDCFKRPDCGASEFYDLVERAEKVLEGTLDTRHG